MLGKSTAFRVDAENDNTEAKLAYTIERFLENKEVMAWWSKHKNIWIGFEDIEKELKKEGLI